MTSFRLISFLALLAFLTTFSITLAKPHSQLIRRQLLANVVELTANGISHAAPLADDILAVGGRLAGFADDVLAVGTRLAGSADEVGAVATAARASRSADQVANGAGILVTDGSSAASRASEVLSTLGPADEIAIRSIADLPKVMSFPQKLTAQWSKFTAFIAKDYAQFSNYAQKGYETFSVITNPYFQKVFSGSNVNRASQVALQRKVFSKFSSSASRAGDFAGKKSSASSRASSMLAAMRPADKFAMQNIADIPKVTSFSSRLTARWSKLTN